MNTRAVPVDNSERLHILLVDNNPVTLEKKAFLLERFGCLVTCSTNGFEANILLETHPGRFDVVMTDYSVKGIKEIKSEKSREGTPVILYLDKDAFMDENFLSSMPFMRLD